MTAAQKILILSLAGALVALAQEVRNPEQWGPYPVGVTSLQFDYTDAKTEFIRNIQEIATRTRKGSGTK